MYLVIKAAPKTARINDKNLKESFSRTTCLRIHYNYLFFKLIYKFEISKYHRQAKNKYLIICVKKMLKTKLLSKVIIVDKYISNLHR